MGASLTKIEGSKYKDLGLVIDATNMAAGATVYSNWIDGVEWVRNIKMLAQSDQQYDIFYQVRDSNQTTSVDSGLGITNQTTTGASQYWRQHPLTGANALLGYGVRFAIKNTSASTNTFGRVRVQLMGL